MIGGECVRLTQGDYDRKTSYYKDPLDVARKYEECGLRRLHLVDLDGAKASHPVIWPFWNESFHKHRWRCNTEAE